MAQPAVNFAFVAAKLARPHVGRVPLRRETLTALRQAIGRRLTVVCAPAGYGKTTAVAAVVERLKLHAVWYKLDVLDHDAVVFIVSLTYALRRWHPEFGDLLLERVQTSAELPFRLEEMAAMFVSECTKLTPRGVHIVLDDYQEAADSAALNWTLDYLLDNLPPHFRMIVVTRYDPSFSVSKLKLSGQVRLLGVDLLRFDPEQARIVLAANTPSIPPTAVERLVDLTEGWPASLVLASFALEWLDLASLETAIADPRLKQDIYSYLAEQVYLRQEEQLQEFLMQTCCLDHVTGPLGDLLAGIDDAERKLNRLAAKQVFTFAAAKEGAYRYHNLFREYLRQRFVHENGRIAFHGLQLRTIDALESCGEIEVAVDLCLTINEPTRALDIIARAGDPGFDNIRSEPLESWVSRLEWSTAAFSPWTRLLNSQIMLRGCRFEAALRSIDEVLPEFERIGERLGMYHAQSARECALFWKGDMEQAAEACRLALGQADTAPHRAHSLISLGSAALETRDWDRAEAAYSEAERLLVGIESPDHQRLRTLKALMKYYRGDFVGSYAEVSRLDFGTKPTANLVASLNSLGVVELALAEYEKALRHFERALDWAEEVGASHLRPLILDCMGFADASLRNPDRGLRTIEAALQDTALQGDPAMRALSLSHCGVILRRTGRLRESLEYFVEAQDVASRSGNPYAHLNCTANLLFAKGLLRRETPEKLRDVVDEASRRRLLFVSNKAVLFMGLLKLELTDEIEAVSTLALCLPTQLTLGHLHLLVQEMRASSQFASIVLERWPSPALVSAFTDASEARAQRQDGGRLEHLTPRETEVLSLMANGARNDEIAKELFLSKATVKTHINHIFTKLEVTNRVQAVLRYSESCLPELTTGRNDH